MFVYEITRKGLSTLIDSVMMDKIGRVPEPDESWKSMNMDSIDFLELMCCLEEEIKTEFNPEEFKTNLLEMPWPEFKTALTETLKVNGYLVITDA